jgi:dephospho-CoA kinase
MTHDNVIRLVYRLGRIHVVGEPGSGKSTLAVQLGVSVYDLDNVAYEGGARWPAPVRR